MSNVNTKLAAIVNNAITAMKAVKTTEDLTKAEKAYADAYDALVKEFSLEAVCVASTDENILGLAQEYLKTSTTTKENLMKNQTPAATTPTQELTPEQKAAKAKAMAALARAKAETAKVAVTTGQSIVNGFVEGHETGKRWSVVVVDKVNNASWLVYGESQDSAMAKAKNFAKATVRGTAKLIAVPAAYLIGFSWGFTKGVFNTFKEVYTNKESAQKADIPAEDIKKLESVATATEEVTN